MHHIRLQSRVAGANLLRHVCPHLLVFRTPQASQLLDKGRKETVTNAAAGGAI